MLLRTEMFLYASQTKLILSMQAEEINLWNNRIVWVNQNIGWGSEEKYLVFQKSWSKMKKNLTFMYQ